MRFKGGLRIIFLSIFLLPCVSFAQLSRSDEIVEVVIFNTKSEYTPRQIITLANNVTPVLKSYPGFLSRNLSEGVNDKDYWVDVVHWSSLSDALSAAQKIENTPQMKKFIATMRCYQMYHIKAKDLGLPVK